MEYIVEEIEKYYLISETGKIYRIRTIYDKLIFKECKPIKLNDMFYITITLNGRQKKYRIDFLVACKYIPNPKYQKRIVHKNKNNYDNNVTNLMWCD